jgi:hypothetical protein
MRIFKLALASLLCTVTMNLQSQTKQDSTDIINVVKNYVDGWYDGDATKMNNALHPMMSKKSQNGEVLSLEKLLELTKNCTGCNPAQRVMKVEILDFFNVTTPEGSDIFNYATVKCESYQYIDYFHISKTFGQWKIGNILWANKTDTLGGTKASLIKAIKDYHTALKTKDTLQLKSVLINNFRSGKAMCYYLIESIDLPWLINNRDNFIEGLATSDSINIEVQDIYKGAIAMAKVTAGDKTELIQLTYNNNSWKLVNIYRNYYTKLREISVSSKAVPSNATAGTYIADFDSRFHYNPDITYSLPAETVDTIYNENFKISNNKLYFNKNASDIITWPQTIRVKVVTVFKDDFLQDITLSKNEILSTLPNNDNNVDREMRITPNPATDNVKIFSPDLNNSIIKFFDSNGREVKRLDRIVGYETNVSISNLNSGLYLISRSNANNNEVVRLIKK